MNDPFADLIVKNDGAPNEIEVTRRLRQIKKKLRQKICHEYDDLPVKIVHSIFEQNFAILSEKYKVEIQLEFMRKAAAKPGFMRRVLNCFRKKKDSPGIIALNEELYQKVEEAIDSWKSGNKRRLSSFFTPKKAVETPTRDERASRTCYEEDWRKSVADESFFTPSLGPSTSTPTTFGRHVVEKEAAKIAGKLKEDSTLMREVMKKLPEEAFDYRENLERSFSFDDD